MSDRQSCPFCIESIHVDATVCPFCQRTLKGGYKGEVMVADRSARRGIGIIMFVQLISLVLLVAINAGIAK